MCHMSHNCIFKYQFRKTKTMGKHENGMKYYGQFKFFLFLLWKIFKNSMSLHSFKKEKDYKYILTIIFK